MCIWCVCTAQIAHILPGPVSTSWVLSLRKYPCLQRPVAIMTPYQSYVTPAIAGSVCCGQLFALPFLTSILFLCADDAARRISIYAQCLIFSKIIFSKSFVYWFSEIWHCDTLKEYIPWVSTTIYFFKTCLVSTVGGSKLSLNHRCTILGCHIHAMYSLWCLCNIILFCLWGHRSQRSSRPCPLHLPTCSACSKPSTLSTQKNL